jgi:hypothetical protein
MDRFIRKCRNDFIRHGTFDDAANKAGKLFAGFYALFSGLALIVVVEIIFAPIVHRFLHKFHLEDEESKTEDS